ncbi:MAG: bacillithiol biosynthesis BshC, partial [Bdellovibrionales bacterium]|nr:bacillithiol biosynthesis BshC [Bdellovibrionales bacterium]
MNQQVQHDQLRDFMSGEESALSLYSYYPYDAKDRSSRIAEVRTEKLAPDVLVAFEESNPNPTAETLANLRYVKSGKDVGFVVTGQQVGLFGGPLLTISKALSAIQLAKALEEESGTKMVPVFWLQTEDHDFQEIATSSCLVFGKRWEQISLQEPLSGVGDSVGKIVLSPSMVQDLEYALRELPIPEERLSPILMAYSTGATLPHAFRSVMNHYIGDSGILFFDPCAPSILKRKVSFLQRSYTEWRAIEELLVERGALLTSRGYSQQVNIRAKTPLFSYSYLGQRARLTRKENRWAHPLGVVTDEELTAFFASANDQLTASALLRPVMQEHFFNSSALVLGPAELRYLGQMSPLYKFFGLSEPLLFPRHSFTLVPEYVEELLEKLSLSPSEAAMDLERYAERLLADKGENVEELFSDLTAA